jgi:hypothetical protein
MVSWSGVVRAVVSEERLCGTGAFERGFGAEKLSVGDNSIEFGILGRASSVVGGEIDPDVAIEINGLLYKSPGFFTAATCG